jgi:hypothetical protein
MTMTDPAPSAGKAPENVYSTTIAFTMPQGRLMWLDGMYLARSGADAATKALLRATPYVRENLVSVRAFGHESDTTERPAYAAFPGSRRVRAILGSRATTPA